MARILSSPEMARSIGEATNVRRSIMSTTARTPLPAQATVNYEVEATHRAAESGTFLRYIRRSNGPRRGMTPQVEAALRHR
jgi:hypothetical protein